MPLSAGPEAHPNGGPSRAERAVRGITPRRRRDVLAAWSAKRGRRSTQRRTPWKQRSQNSAPTHWAKRFARARSCRPAWAARPCSDAQVVYPLAAPANEQIRPMKLRTARLVPRRPAPVQAPAGPNPALDPDGYQVRSLRSCFLVTKTCFHGSSRQAKAVASRRQKLKRPSGGYFATGERSGDRRPAGIEIGEKPGQSPAGASVDWNCRRRGRYVTVTYDAACDLAV